MDENCLGILIFCPFVQISSDWLDLGECIIDHALTKIRTYQMAEKPPSTANSTPFT